ncbi:MAG TPA: hypothetical protein VFJ57_12770 [Solirubrobacterales bacterium]|nr:hypothetical protein [Solirubrobacterales bacterium]
MDGAGVLQGSQWRRLALIGAVALLGVAVLVTALAQPAGAGLVGKDGKVYACYRTKGKAKGAVRLVAKKKKCRKGEKRISWNATGPAGVAGENGSGGEPGGGGEIGATGLEGRIEKLTNRVETLEEKLKGITNATLNEVISKLQGVSGKQLQDAVAAVADVNALCAQATTLTNRVNSLGTALGGTALTGVIPLGLALLVPGLPSSLPAFGCPP